MLSFDVIAETLRRTNLGKLTANSAVNYERSARVGDEIGGHNVSGHVHTTASISSISKHGDDVRLQFAIQDTAWAKYILPKGFVAVDGCSLTVGEVRRTLFGQLEVAHSTSAQLRNHGGLQFTQCVGNHVCA